MQKPPLELTSAHSAQNGNLNRARAVKFDEFYTQLPDIERELAHYKPHFRGKTVLCNCDDPRVSNFFHYFSLRFEPLGLKKLVTTCYKSQARDMFSRHDSEQAISLEYTGDRNQNRIPDPEEIGIKPLQGDGDFRSEECMALLREADIVVTNPPFSLFREYVAQLVEYQKQFLILGNPNAISYKEIFPLLKANQMWLGMKSFGTDMLFDVPEDYAKELVATKKEGSAYKIENGVIKGRTMAIWFTNLDHPNRHKELKLYKAYNSDDYPKYDNRDAINVDKVKNIPADYAGVMGVPISFLDKHNPEQFEIVGFRRRRLRGHRRPAAHYFHLPVCAGGFLV